MVTYGDLFTYSLVIIGIIGLCMHFRTLYGSEVP